MTGKPSESGVHWPELSILAKRATGCPPKSRHTRVADPSGREPPVPRRQDRLLVQPARIEGADDPNRTRMAITPHDDLEHDSALEPIP